MTPFEKRSEMLAKTVIKNLENRHFEAYYCPTVEEAKEKALSLIPEGSSVSWGGSETVAELGLREMVKAGNYTVIDRDLAKTPEERVELQRQALLADVFLMSTNAMSENGILVNIDGNGNRLAALCYGPKSVIVVCGVNKIAQDLDAAVKRARSIAAPINASRLPATPPTPCMVTGVCANCTSENCICSEILVTRTSRPAGKVKVILIGENVGF